MLSSKQSTRLYSLDVFRGITIAFMILVNTADLSPAIHPWLAHSYWNGCTLADWVFPFFLFIVGVALAFSLGKYNPDNRPTWKLYVRLLRRGVVLFLLGLVVNGFWSYEWGTFQLTGVLQRISLAYLATALIALNLPRKVQWWLTGMLLLSYWVAYVAFPIPEPEYRPDTLTHTEVSTFGIMSWFGMLPTIAIVLMGYFTGAWLHTEVVIKNLRSASQSMTLVLFGISSIILGQLWSIWLPLNKKLWTSSYVLFTVGLALLLLAACYELIEIRGKSRWSHPLRVLGVNSIFIYVSASLALKLLERAQIGSGNSALSSYLWLDQHLFLSWCGVATAGFLFALVTLFLWWLIAYCLYWRRWLITI